MNYEGWLPAHKRLDEIIEREMSVFVQDLAQLKQETGDVIVPDIEFDTDSTAEHFEGMALYLIEGGFVDSNGKRTDYLAVYRAALFAYQIAVSILREDAAFNAYEYLESLKASSDNPKQRFIDDVRGYLDENPSIIALVAAHAQDIHDDARQLDAIMYTAGATFMLVERHEGEKYAHAAFADIEPEDIIHKSSE